ncbi:YIP1 family protein [Alteromonas gilva]|uniref:YIP1 family protein n=1 Tax=Alteromonas gilva TaxID=2987522 RepID=A0ABT5L9W1_9ALTE|nr:YIP1 family protein [Alteromonas gilva]MDC8832898.1 YIP1 family protein [Alteromonas gilva]
MRTLLLVEFLSTPKNGLPRLHSGKNFIAPILIIILCNVVMLAFVFGNIDHDWYIDNLIEVKTINASNAEKQQITEIYSMLSPTQLGITSMITAAFLLPAAFCLISLYFYMASKMLHAHHEFRQWLTLVAWSYIPSLLGVFSSIVMVLISDYGRYLPDTANPLSLNSLFFNLPLDSKLSSFFNTVDLTLLWTITLMVIGFSSWVNIDRLKSVVIVCLPFAIFFISQYLLS